MFGKKHGRIILSATQSTQFLSPALLQAYIMTLRTSCSSSILLLICLYILSLVVMDLKLPCNNVLLLHIDLLQGRWMNKFGEVLSGEAVRKKMTALRQATQYTVLLRNKLRTLIYRQPMKLVLCKEPQDWRSQRLEAQI